MNTVVRPLPLADNDAALALWEGSMRATHHFVAEGHARQYKAMVRDMLQTRPLDMYGLYAEGEKGLSLLAIMGVEADEAMMGMLFVAAEQRGRGYGTLLLRHALALGVRKVDVNEQNTAARNFYERAGFVACGRTPLDGAGNPYPLVHMILP